MEKEVIRECLIIKEKIAGVRAKILPHLNSASELNGCLRGSLNVYLDSFDGQISTLKAKFDQDRKYWTQLVQE